MPRLSLFLVLAASLLVVGCGSKVATPITSHGQPISHWIGELSNPNVAARKKAVVALGHAGVADASCVTALTTALKDSDATVRDEAVLALMNLGPIARPAVENLREMLADPDFQVRDHAAKAIAHIEAAR
jgi:HEAT repeat protein